MKPACAITGSTGYVGSRLAEGISPDFTLVRLTRNPGPAGILWTFDQTSSLADGLRAHEVSTLLHIAWDFRHPKPADNWRTNVEGSRALLEIARSSGVERFVFISSISSFPGARSEYGKSKFAVEQEFLALGGTVIRPGLVWGDRPGGMFGSLRQQTAKGGTLPMIGDGSYPQYLVHEDDLAETVRRACLGEWPGQTLTVAHPEPWPLKKLTLCMASEQGMTVKPFSIPWRPVFFALKTAEALGVKTNFRSDSLISLVRQDPAPQFARELPLRPFACRASIPQH